MKFYLLQIFKFFNICYVFENLKMRAKCKYTLLHRTFQCLPIFTQISITRMSLNVRITRMHIYVNAPLHREWVGHAERALNPTDTFSAS